MADDGFEVGRLFVGVGMDLDTFDKQAKKDLRERAEAAAEEAEMLVPVKLDTSTVPKDAAVVVSATTAATEAVVEAAEGAAASVAQMATRTAASLKAVVEAAGGEIVALRATFAQAERDAQKGLLEGSINQAEFKRLGKEAAQALNEGLDEVVQRVSKTGALDPQMMIDIESFKRTGADAGFAVIESTKQKIGAMTQDLRLAFSAAMADATEARASGALDTEGFARRGAEAAEEFNRGILAKIKELADSGRLTPDLHAALTRELKKAGFDGGKAFDEGAREGFTDFQKFLRGAFAAGVAVAVLGAFRKMVDIARDAAGAIKDALGIAGTVQATTAALDSLAAGARVSASELRGSMRTAARGLVTDLELAQRAAKLLQSQLPLTADGMAEIITVSRRLGATLGLDASQALEQFTNGLVTGRPTFIRHLGIVTTMEDALARHTARTGESTKAMSAQQKQAIYYADVMEQARRKVAQLGEEQLTVSDRLAQAATAWGNIRTATLTAIAESPRITQFLDSIGDGAEKSGQRVDQLADKIAALVDAYADMSIDDMGPVWRLLAGEVGLMGKAAGWGARQLGMGVGLDKVGERQSFHEERRARERRIKDEESTAQLLLMQVEAERDLARLGEARGKTAERDRAQLEREVALIKQQRASIFAAREGAGADAAARAEEERLRKAQAEREEAAKQSDAERKAAERLVKAAQDRNLSQTERQIRTLREQAAAARLLSDVGLAAELEAEADALERLARWAQDFAPALSDVADAADPAIRALSPAEAVAAHTAAFETEMATLRERLARGLIDPKTFEAEGRKAGAAFNAGILSVLDGLREAGKLTQTEFQKLANLLKDDRERDDPEARARALEREAREYANVARGVLSVADAMGSLDRDTRQALDGVILLVENLAAMRAASKAGAALSLGSVTGAIGGIAALVAAFSGLFQKDHGVRVRQLDATRTLTRALEDLRTAVLQDISVAERERLQGVGERFMGRESVRLNVEGAVEGMGTRRLPGDLSAEEFDFLKQLQEITDVAFLDVEKGRIDFLAFGKAWEAFLAMDVAGFTEDLSGRIDALDYAARIAGDRLGTAAEQMERFIATVGEFSPEFAAEFGRIFREEGAEAARQWAEEQAILFAQGGAAALGAWAKGFTPAEIQRVIDAALERAEAGGLVGGTEATRLSVGITEMQANVLLQYQASQLHHLAGIHEVLRAGLGGGPLSTITPPSAAALGLAPGSATTVLDFGDLSVQVSLSGSASRAEAEGVGRAAGVAFGDAFTERLAARYRAQGLQRPRFLTDQERAR